jgi:hypothetical protein
MSHIVFRSEFAASEWRADEAVVDIAID